MIPRSILGRPFASDISTPAVAAWLEREWFFSDYELPKTSFGIRLEEIANAPAERRGTDVSVALHDVTLLGRSERRTWTFGGADRGVQLTLSDEGSHIALWGPPDFAALFVALGESVRASGLLPLHASVVARDGVATALAGRSGVGKSTTLWRAMQDGWSPIAEDFAWLDPVTLEVYRWDRGIRIHADAWERFAQTIPLDRFRVEIDGKLFLAYERFASGARTGRLQRLVRLERDGCGAGDALTPLAPRDAVRAWWEMVGVPLDQVTRRSVSQTIAELARRIPSFELRLGPAAPPL